MLLGYYQCTQGVTVQVAVSHVAVRLWNSLYPSHKCTYLFGFPWPGIKPVLFVHYTLINKYINDNKRLQTKINSSQPNPFTWSGYVCGVGWMVPR